MLLFVYLPLLVADTAVTDAGLEIKKNSIKKLIKGGVTGLVKTDTLYMYKSTAYWYIIKKALRLELHNINCMNCHYFE